MGDVEALDALGKFRQAKLVLQRFLYDFRRGLQHSEALIEGLLGILPDQVDQRALLAALRDRDLDPRPSRFPQHLFQ